MPPLERISATLAVAFTAACGASADWPPPPPPPPPPPDDDRPVLQVAVDPPTPIEPPAAVAAPRCGPPAPAGRLARCAPLAAFRAAATSASPDATLAFDGDGCSIWNSGGFAPQSVMVDLGAARRIDGILLVPEMTPSGAVVHRVELSDRDDPRSFQSAHRIEAPMTTGVAVELRFPRPERARFVQVATEASPSWIAWREIVLYDCGGP